MLRVDGLIKSDQALREAELSRNAARDCRNTVFFYGITLCIRRESSLVR